MDLVTRLREYIDHIAMPVTQFADACGIPRPSMSQLLSGRNKKVSNELITKIHDAFPDLNVLWLMFGQGDMLVNLNMPLSEPQNGSESSAPASQSSQQQHIAKTVLEFEDTSIFDPDNFTIEEDASTTGAYASPLSPPPLSVSSAEASTPVPSPAATVSNGGIAAAAAIKAADSSKRIVNIIVYYSDNSFEAFVPE